MGHFLFDLLNLPIFHSISPDQLLDAEKNFYDTLKTYWRENNYLTPQWWILVFLSILAPIIWFKFVDKKRMTEITLMGLFYGIAAIILDSIGSITMVWIYPVHLTPYLYPQIYPYDVCVVIIPFMMLYQRWGNDLKRFFLFTAFLSAFLAFIAEPSMEWLGIYKELTWKHIYSFPIYWMLGITCWFIIRKFKKAEQKQ